MRLGHEKTTARAETATRRFTARWYARNKKNSKRARTQLLAATKTIAHNMVRKLVRANYERQRNAPLPGVARGACPRGTGMQYNFAKTLANADELPFRKVAPTKKGLGHWTTLQRWLHCQPIRHGSAPCWDHRIRDFAIPLSKKDRAHAATIAAKARMTREAVVWGTEASATSV